MKQGLAIGLLLLAAVGLPVVVSVLAVVGSEAPPLRDARDNDLVALTSRLLRREMVGTISVLKLSTELFELPTLAPAEATGVLRLLYKQDPDLTVVALLDGQDQAVVEPAFLDHNQVLADGGRQVHLPVDAADMGQFLKRIPFEAIRAQGMAFSDVYADPHRNVVLLAGGIRIPSGELDQPAYLLVFERSLRGLQKAVAAGARSSSGAEIFVVDGGGRLVAHPDGNRALGRQTMLNNPLVDRHLAGERSSQLDFSGQDGRTWSGAFQRLDFLDWAVMVQRPGAVQRRGAIPAWAWFAWLVVGVAIGAVGLLVMRSVGSQEALIAGLRNQIGELEAKSDELAAGYERRATELQQVQASLLETRKLNAIGDLGAGVAHELNNPLGGILGLTQLLLRRKKEGDPDLQFLGRIEEEAKRCKTITDNLLRFSEQQGAEHREPLRLERVLDKALDLIDSRLVKQRVTIDRDYQVGAPRILGSEARLQRAFLNVLHNAETAMPDGGQLRLRIFCDEESLLVQIIDTGRGIPDENLSRVFEPFFTTKDNWKGAGLGLWVVYQIIEEHDGVVSVESEEGKGTTVKFRLPVAQAKSESGSTVPLA